MISRIPKRRTISRFRKGLWHAFYGSSIYPLLLSQNGPSKVRGVPPDLWPGDPVRAETIMAGAFLFNGQAVPLNEGGWADTTDNTIAAAAFHSFSWLRDLRDSGNESARMRAQEMTAKWIASNERWKALSWRPDILGERLANWLTNLSFMCPDQSSDLRRKILHSSANQVRHLNRAHFMMDANVQMFPVLKGMIYCGLCFPNHEDSLETGLFLLEKELSDQILPDGGHIQRNPSYHLVVLRHLLDIRCVLAKARQNIPDTLQDAIERMTPMLRTFRLGDGGLALFNGAFEEDAAAIDTLLSRTDVKKRGLTSALHSGFQKISAGRSTLLIDTGEPPPGGYDLSSHAGLLSFEMSVAKERLITNCGAYCGDNATWSDAARATAAHSTLCINDTNSVEVHNDYKSRRRAISVTSRRRESDEHTLLEASHDGYKKPFGLIHYRTLYLDTSGEELSGEDSLFGNGGGQFFALRFHLHPQVQASLLEGDGSVLLKLAKGGGWKFLAEGAETKVEESVYLGKDDNPRKSKQIVVSGPVTGKDMTVKWRLHCLS
jgi:uncharacterized heparinase superfamily protein